MKIAERVNPLERPIDDDFVWHQRELAEEMRAGQPRLPLIRETKLAPAQVSKVEIPSVAFTDVTSSAGIRFQHENGARGKKLLPKTMGGGCAFFDFDGDGDGDQDLMLVNGQTWPWDNDTNIDGEERPATLALYRNDGTGHFDNVTAASGLDMSLYGMGAAVGDYDRDGRVDVFVSAVGTNHLFHNEGAREVSRCDRRSRL